MTTYFDQKASALRGPMTAADLDAFEEALLGDMVLVCESFRGEPGLEFPRRQRASVYAALRRWLPVAWSPSEPLVRHGCTGRCGVGFGMRWRNEGAMSDVKGYLVKGTWRGEGGPCDVYAYWWTLYGPAGEVQWCDDRAIASERGRLLFPTVGEADAARCKSSHLSDVSIYRVLADGREERLPSLEEAIAEIERLRGAAPILLEGVPAIMHSSAPASREEIGAAACQMLKAIERALSVLRGSEPADGPLGAPRVAS